MDNPVNGSTAGPASLDDLRKALPAYARDLALNLGSVLTPAGAPGLDERHIWTVAVSSALAARNAAFVRALEGLAAPILGAGGLETARAAAAIMGMNNVYYRFLHFVEDPEYQQLPARLRMSVIAQQSDRVAFELASLAVSAINGCGACVASHERQIRKHGLTREAVQSAVRIASVVSAVARVLEYEGASPEPAASA